MNQKRKKEKKSPRFASKDQPTTFFVVDFCVHGKFLPSAHEPKTRLPSLTALAMPCLLLSWAACHRNGKCRNNGMHRSALFPSPRVNLASPHLLGFFEGGTLLATLHSLWMDRSMSPFVTRLCPCFVIMCYEATHCHQTVITRWTGPRALMLKSVD